MDYLTKKVLDLSEVEQRKIMSALVDKLAADPVTRSDKYDIRLMSDYTDEARIRLQNWGKVQGIRTGYAQLDEMTKGLVGGELIIVAGKTSHGKTTLAMNIANNVALAGHTVLFVTLEMTHAELTSRYMFINGGETEDYGVVSNNTAFQHKDELNWQDIDGLIGKAVKDFGVELVVIDHLHYFTRELERIAEDLGRITKQFKQNAKAYDLPIMLISHVRKTENGKKATIDDLRSSSYIAQDADIVLMVEQGDPENLTQITMEKNRNRGVDRREEKNVMVVKNVETKMVEQRRQQW